MRGAGFAGTGGSGGPLFQGDEAVAGDSGNKDASRSDGKAPNRSDGAAGSGDSDSQVVVDADAGDQDAQSNQNVITSPGVAYGEWTYYEVSGAVCRDGSAAGYYIRKGTSNNLMIFLNGGGVCYDDFFCGLNPANVDQSLPGATLGEATIQTFFGVLIPLRQIPPSEGIFLKDSRNPVADWTMVYVPYCTGDVYAGTHRDAKVITSTLMGPQQFVGYTNIGLFYQSFGPDYMDSEKVLLTGSSAGGFGALLNFDRTQQFFKKSRVIAITDAGIPFSDPTYMETCLQKNWRELWGINDILPKDCKNCFNADGGGLTNLAKYITEVKYKGRMLGGGISSDQDEIMKLFFSAGLNNCTINTASEAIAAAMGVGSYPADRYPAGLTDFLENQIGMDNCGSYMVSGTAHQFLFRAEFYLDNGTGMILADWVKDIIDGKATHVGVLP